MKGQYLSKIFVDPKTNLSYKYTLKNLGKDYELCVKFETKREECVGKKDGIFLNAIAYIILKEKLYNQEFIDTRTKEFETYKNSILK